MSTVLLHGRSGGRADDCGGDTAASCASVVTRSGPVERRLDAAECFSAASAPVVRALSGLNSSRDRTACWVNLKRGWAWMVVAAARACHQRPGEYVSTDAYLQAMQSQSNGRIGSRETSDAQVCALGRN